MAVEVVEDPEAVEPDADLGIEGEDAKVVSSPDEIPKLTAMPQGLSRVIAAARVAPPTDSMTMS